MWSVHHPQITFVQFPWYITISASLRPSSKIFVYLRMYNWQIINRAFEFSVISVKGTIAEMALVLVLKTNKDLFQVFSKSVKTDPNNGIMEASVIFHYCTQRAADHILCKSHFLQPKCSLRTKICIHSVRSDLLALESASDQRLKSLIHS